MPTEVEPNYGHVSVPYKAWGGLLTVTIQNQLQGRSFGDLLAGQKRLKAINTTMIEEWCIINGNVSDDSDYFDGFDTLITTEVAYDATATTPYQECVGRACRDIKKAGGLARYVLWGFEVHFQFVKEAMAYLSLHQNDPARPFDNMRGGISIDKWNFGHGRIDIIESQYINTASGYTTQSAFVIDDMSLDMRNQPNGNVVTMVDLAVLEFIELAMLATAWRPLVFSMGALKISAPLFQRKLTGMPDGT